MAKTKKLTPFWKVRIATFIWGFCCVLWFTGRIDLSSKLFLTQVAGNSLIMWWFLRPKKEYVKT
jgi:hypothetical protein